LLIVQVGLVVRDALALVQAAREGARAAAVSASDDDAFDAVRRAAGPLDEESIEIVVEPPEASRERGSPVTVRLTYQERLRIPIVSRIAELDVPLHAASTMRLERSFPTPAPEPTPSPSPSPTVPP